VALRLGPFALLRERVSDEEYAGRARAALAAVVPVSELLRGRRARPGSTPTGETHTSELRAVREHLERLRAIERDVSDVRPSGGLSTLHRALVGLLDAYARTLRSYAGACEALAAADEASYRAHNTLGRAQDERTCEAARTLADALERAPAGIDLPAALRRAVEHAAAYRRLIGGAFAYWE
jgi:hypothetical protein